MAFATARYERGAEEEEALPSFMMPERKEEAASAAELAVEPAGNAGIAEAAERGADGATTEPEEFTGISGVSAREREVESTRPHGAEEGRTEAEEAAL